jgi:hypothetical protein
MKGVKNTPRNKHAYDTDFGMSQEEVAAIEGVTRERIRQIEELALKKIEFNFPILMKVLRKDLCIFGENYSPTANLLNHFNKTAIKSAKARQRIKNTQAGGGE